MDTPLTEASLVYSFESDDSLSTMPLSARRVLDLVGRKLSLEGWLSLSLDDRRRIVRAGVADEVDPEVLRVLEGATPAPATIDPIPDPDPAHPPRELVEALGSTMPLQDAAWSALRPLDRYALVKCAHRPPKLARAYDAIVVSRPGSRPGIAADGNAVLTHLTKEGAAHMVPVGAKAETVRRAVASGRVTTTRAVIEAVVSGAMPKGDVLAAARIAGFMAAKKTADLIPLCHPVRVTGAVIDIEPDATREELRVTATVDALDRTGVEMEAIVAVSVTCLTIYDMIKGADRWATVEAVRLEAKSGGKSGDVRRPPEGRGSG
jgi:cyclic pyranopterin phosphate synthase